MNRTDVKAAADAIGRLEALERALISVEKVPHQALPISFFDAGDSDDHQNDHGIKAYYPREFYKGVVSGLIAQEQMTLAKFGVKS